MKISIQYNGGYRLLEPGEIHYCKADGSYTHIFLEGLKKITVARPLKVIFRELPAKMFCRCHRSYVVNLEKILSFTQKELSLITGMTLPVARRRYYELVKMISEKEAHR